MYERALTQTLLDRLAEPVRHIQVITGPRQVGKTTLVRHLLQTYRQPNQYLYLTLDEPVSSKDGTSPALSPPAGTAPDREWLTIQWERAKAQALSFAGKQANPADQPSAQPPAFVLVLDELQKLPDWSSAVKGLWDADRAKQLPMHVVILGSSTLLMQRGLAESLMGCFERLQVTHWSFSEMHEAFGLSLEEYVYFGGYPGSIAHRKDPSRWQQYIWNALIEPSIQKEILMMHRIHKPQLLKDLFELGCAFSGQQLSYTRMLGHLRGAGNTTTLARYLALLNAAGLLAGLERYTTQGSMHRASNPKLVVHNTALMSATASYTYEEALADRTHWGYLVKSAVGAHLINAAIEESDYGIHYWQEGGKEVDFVLARSEKCIAVEVKSGGPRGNGQGLDAFTKRFAPQRRLIVGEDVPLDEFLTTDPEEWFHNA